MSKMIDPTKVTGQDFQAVIGKPCKVRTDDGAEHHVTLVLKDVKELSRDGLPPDAPADARAPFSLLLMTSPDAPPLTQAPEGICTLEMDGLGTLEGAFLNPVGHSPSPENSADDPAPAPLLAFEITIS